jgi:hypothetical protein
MSLSRMDPAAASSLCFNEQPCSAGDVKITASAIQYVLSRGESTVNAPLVVKGSHKADEYFVEELKQLNIEPEGLLGEWRCKMGSTTNLQSSGIPSPVRSRQNVKIGEINLSAQLADMTAGCVLEESDRNCCEDLRAMFLSNLQNRNSFKAKIPAAKIGLLYTDCASSVLTKSFIQRTLGSEEA